MHNLAYLFSYTIHAYRNLLANGLGMRVVGGLRKHANILGAYVISVEPNGPAASCGIERGKRTQHV